MKKGDILYCKKIRSRFHRDRFPEFTDGKQYEISEVMMGSVDGSGIPISTLIIKDDLNHMRFLNHGQLLNLAQILKTQKEVRKEKLNKLKTFE